jgi:hypothetical protein
MKDRNPTIQNLINLPKKALSIFCRLKYGNIVYLSLAEGDKMVFLMGKGHKIIHGKIPYHDYAHCHQFGDIEV